MLRHTRLAVLAGIASIFLLQPLLEAKDARIDYSQLQRSLSSLLECQKDLMAWVGARVGSLEFEITNDLVDAISTAFNYIKAIEGLYTITEMCSCQSALVSRYLQSEIQNYMQLLENRLEVINLSLSRAKSSVVEDAGLRARTEIRNTLEMLRQFNQMP